jgi:hypothetical protein
MNIQTILKNERTLRAYSLSGILYEVKSQSLKWKPRPPARLPVRPSVAQYQRLNRLANFDELPCSSSGQKFVQRDAFGGKPA